MQDIFAQDFKPKRITDNPSDEKLRQCALEKGGVITEFGNPALTTSVRNRIAKFTEVVMGKISQEDAQLVYEVLQ